MIVDLRQCGRLFVPVINGDVKSIAVIFGIAFIAIGILGFVPAIAPDGMLLKIFHVNAAHNVVHLATGIVALLCGMSGAGAARTFFQIFGIVYAIVAILGFVKGDDINIWIISNNVADTWLHVVIAVVSLFLGFGMAKQTASF